MCDAADFSGGESIVRTCLLAAAASLLIAAAPPVAPVEPVTETIHGTSVTDNYRWMESGKDPRWLPWLKAQAGHTRTVLDALPGRAALLKEISDRSGALPAIGPVRSVGDVMVWQERPVGAQDFRLMARIGKAAPRVLFETVPGQAGAEVIDGWSISPDGRHVALESSVRGTERSGISVIEVATGRRGEVRLPDSGAAQWLPDSQGFTYVHFVGEHGTPTYMLNTQPRVYQLGQPASASKALAIRGAAGVEIRPEQFAFVGMTRNAPHGFLMVRDGRQEFALYRAPLAAALSERPGWKRVVDFADTIVDFSAAGDDLYVTARKAHPNGRVLRMSAAAPDLASATAIALPGDPVIDAIAAAKSGVFIKTIEGGVSGLWFAPKDGPPRRWALPSDGTIGWIENEPGRDDALITLAGWFAPPKVFHLATNGESHDIGFVPDPPFPVADYVATRGTARSHDGTMIPYTVLTSRSAKVSGPRPVLLDAYGSYGSSQLPRFRSWVLPFLDRGGAYVVANVRGGGEFGRAWHYAGKAQTKRNTWMDAIAVAEKLNADGLASPATTTLIGTSAGGVTVGGAVNERPDLFAGAIANVGFMNPTRYVAEQNFGDIEEWGGPIKDAATYRVMAALDPTLNIRKGARYPATLVISGLNDPRAATFHSAKYAASLAVASSSGEPVLLRIDFDAGHGAGFGSSRAQADAQSADVLSFVLWQAGAKDFQPRP